MFEAIRNRLLRWHLSHIARRKLKGLDDRLLADIGTSRENIVGFVDAQPLPSQSKTAKRRPNGKLTSCEPASA